MSKMEETPPIPSEHYNPSTCQPQEETREARKISGGKIKHYFRITVAVSGDTRQQDPFGTWTLAFEQSVRLGLSRYSSPLGTVRASFPAHAVERRAFGAIEHHVAVGINARANGRVCGQQGERGLARARSERQRNFDRYLQFLRGKLRIYVKWLSFFLSK